MHLLVVGVVMGILAVVGVVQGDQELLLLVVVEVVLGGTGGVAESNWDCFCWCSSRANLMAWRCVVMVVVVCV